MADLTNSDTAETVPLPTAVGASGSPGYTQFEEASDSTPFTDAGEFPRSSNQVDFSQVDFNAPDTSD